MAIHNDAMRDVYVLAVDSVGSRRGFFLSGRLRWDTILSTSVVGCDVSSGVRVVIQRVLAMGEGAQRKGGYGKLC
jgi:hypothetical protein